MKVLIEQAERFSEIEEAEQLPMWLIKQGSGSLSYMIFPKRGYRFLRLDEKWPKTVGDFTYALGPIPVLDPLDQEWSGDIMLKRAGVLLSQGDLLLQGTECREGIGKLDRIADWDGFIQSSLDYNEAILTICDRRTETGYKEAFNRLWKL